jgi:6,7-dimethyl-8-ribityllumazine synthase
MSTKLKNLSSSTGGNIPSAEKMRFGIVVSEWNTEITQSLLNGAEATLLRHGAKQNNIIIHHVPGSFELPMGAQLIAEYKKIDAIICLGCVIQGETRHFEFICNAVANGITRVNLDYNIPVIFGLLTTNDQQQAIDRSGGKHGNKGDEAAFTAIKMVDLKNNLKSKSTVE